MFSGKLTNKNKGSIMLPTLGKRAKVAGDTFVISEKEFWNDDIKKAFRDGLIIFNEKVPTAKKTNLIQNVSPSSIMLGKIGALRSYEVKEISEEDNGNTDLIVNINNGKIVQLKSMKSALVRGKQKSPVDEKMSAVVHKPNSEPIQKKNKKDKTIKKVSSDDLIIENGVEPGSDEDNIKFVDIEQAEQRIAAHPVLSKKIKANNRR